MTATTRKTFQLLACAIGLVTLTACGWVDSKGVQSVTVANTDGLRNAQPLTITENTSVNAELVGEGSELAGWTWTPDNKNEIYRCAGINGFDIDHAVTSINDACTSQTNCTITISESKSENETQFAVTVPELKAPLAISYNVTTTRDDGAFINRQQLLCAIPINEAPQALDDNYVARRNTTLVVNAQDPDSLLANDTDDTDFRNSALRVVTTPVKAPLYASDFSLNADGGFIYQASADAPADSAGLTEDYFEYSITDGVHVVNAIAYIKSIDSNKGPKQLQQIPDVVFTADDGETNAHIRQIDLSQFFHDADGDNLSFVSENFKSTFGLTLSLDGVLTADASILDVNQWRATVKASDGIESAEASFVVTVRLPESIKLTGDNDSPTVTDIKNSSFTGEFAYDVSIFFNDSDEDDQLTFTARGLPAGIQIRADGVIEGTVANNNKGSSFVQVTAEDGYGGLVVDGFNLILN